MKLKISNGLLYSEFLRTVSLFLEAGGRMKYLDLLGYIVLKAIQIILISLLFIMMG